MRSHILLLLSSLMSCEHASDLAANPTPVMPVASVDAPNVVAVSVSRELPVPVREYTLDTSRSPRRMRVSDLPRPPSDEPRAYAAWLQTLSVDEVADITAYCSQHRLDYKLVCGGIGPLHIPLPPHMLPRPMRIPVRAPGQPMRHFASMDRWESSLNPLQQQYVMSECENIGEDGPSSDLCGPMTPLVIAFGNEAVTYMTGGRFAFHPGIPFATDWPTAVTPWLVLDRDSNGSIDSGAELFGSDTPLAAGGVANNGFTALTELDSDRNGRIDRDDAAFASLQLWADRDGDRRSTADELTPVSASIVSLSLANEVDLRCDARGNCEGERAAIHWRDATGTVQTGSIVDIYLPRR